MDDDFDRFNYLIGHSEDVLEKAIQDVYDKAYIERIEKNADSVRLVIAQTYPRLNYTFFIKNGNLNHVGVTMLRLKTQKMRKYLESKYQESQLSILQGTKFQNYSNEIHQVLYIYEDKKTSSWILLVSYPDHGKRRSNLVIFKM